MEKKGDKDEKALYKLMKNVDTEKNKGKLKK